jgi:hypothetical protein
MAKREDQNMTVEVNYDSLNRRYVVSDAGRQLAILPQVYLEGRKSSHINKNDIEKAFSEVFDYETKYSSDFQRRDAALVSLGLLQR